jgi:hypothetical protein
MIHKILHFHLHNDNTNFGSSHKDQEFLDKLKLPDCKATEQLTSPSPPRNPCSSAINSKIHIVEIPHFEIDRS